MLTNDQVFDMLPYVVDMWEKLDLDNYRKQVTAKNKGKEVDKIGMGIEVFKHILKNSGKVKEEIFSMVGVVEGKTSDEMRNQSFGKTLLTFKMILSDSEAMAFFKQAM